MDGNKDESERCISIAKKYIASGNNEKALKFLNKAERLYPSNKAKDLIDDILQMNEPDDVPKKPDGGSAGTEGSEGVKHRRGSGSRESSDNKQSEERDYTQEQLDSVKRIKHCKDYYEILGVEKDCTENDLKKAYRKLALQMHPDKNKAPGATEAFKGVGNAFAVLSDPEKKRKYDLYGPEDQIQRHHHSHDYDYTHGYEGDISPEELFNMFFGGGFPSGRVYTRHNRPASRQTFYHRETHSNDGGYTLLLQLAPILLLVFLSVLSSFFVGDPVYSMQKSDKYSVSRETQSMRIPYFVKSDFKVEFKGDLRRIERQVEEEYVSNLRANCWRERSYKENMLWKARNFADARLYEKAQNMQTPSCEQLHRMYS